MSTNEYEGYSGVSIGTDVNGQERAIIVGIALFLFFFIFCRWMVKYKRSSCVVLLESRDAFMERMVMI